MLNINIIQALAAFEGASDKWWLRPENTIYVPMLPMIYEATDLIDDLQESNNEYGPTKLVVNRKEVSRVNFNDEYNEIGNNFHKSVRIPLAMIKTRDIEGAKLVITENTTLVATYDKNYEYCEIIPFVGIHNDFLTGKRNGIDSSVKFPTPGGSGGYKHLDANVLREHLSKLAVQAAEEEELKTMMLE